MEETLSLEDVMIQLRLTSEELHQLVQRGELKAQTDAAGAMRFQQADIDAYKARVKPQSVTDVLVIPPRLQPARERVAVAAGPPPAPAPAPAAPAKKPKKKAAKRKPAPKKKPAARKKKKR